MKKKIIKGPNSVFQNKKLNLLKSLKNVYIIILDLFSQNLLSKQRNFQTGIFFTKPSNIYFGKEADLLEMVQNFLLSTVLFRNSTKN